MSSSSPPPDPRTLISCLDTTNALFYCGSPAHQLDRYWKDGALDSCMRQLDEVKLCVRLKFADAPTTRAILQRLLEASAKPAPTMGVVWEPRREVR